MNNLPELLAKLAEVGPEVCQRKNWRETLDTYHIGDYVFWFVQGDLRAHSEASGSSDFIEGRPALDWLQGALQQVCEGKGWDYKIGQYGGRMAELWTRKQRIYRYCEYPLLECIIAALQLQDK